MKIQIKGTNYTTEILGKNKAKNNILYNFYRDGVWFAVESGKNRQDAIKSLRIRNAQFNSEMLNKS